MVHIFKVGHEKRPTRFNHLVEGGYFLCYDGVIAVLNGVVWENPFCLEMRVSSSLKYKLVQERDVHINGQIITSPSSRFTCESLIAQWVPKPDWKPAQKCTWWHTWLTLNLQILQPWFVRNPSWMFAMRFGQGELTAIWKISQATSLIPKWSNFKLQRHLSTKILEILAKVRDGNSCWFFQPFVNKQDRKLVLFFISTIIPVDTHLLPVEKWFS